METGIFAKRGTFEGGGETFTILTLGHSRSLEQRGEVREAVYL